MASRNEIGQRVAANLVDKMDSAINPLTILINIDIFSAYNKRIIELTHKHGFLTADMIDKLLHKKIIEYTKLEYNFIINLDNRRQKEYIADLDHKDSDLFTYGIKFNALTTEQLSKLSDLFPKPLTLNQFIERNFSQNTIDYHRNLLLNPPKPYTGHCDSDHPSHYEY